MTKSFLFPAFATFAMVVSAQAQDVDAPYFIAQAQNTTFECDGTDSYKTALATWLATNGNAVAYDDVDGYALVWSNNYVAAAQALLAASTDPAVQAQAATFTSSTTTAQAIAAADYLANAVGELSFTVTFTATDASGNSSSTTATFSVVDTIAPVLNWSVGTTAIADYAIYTVTSQALPITITVDPADACDGSDLALNKSFSFTGSTTTPGVTYTGNSFTVTSGAVGTEIKLYASGTDESGNVSALEYIIVTIEAPPGGGGCNGGGGSGGNNGHGNCKAKGNEGLGNGVDPNTPGHQHNGGNDDPAFKPGNPGARYKNKNR